MKKLVFTEDMFPLHSDPEYSKKIITRRAQAYYDGWFQREIESAPVYTGYLSAEKGHFFEKSLCSYHTHTARLILIEEIKKECVKHEPEPVMMTNLAGLKYRAYSDVCKHCGVSLIAEWKEVKP